jgi:type II secretory pathway component PulF
LPLLQNPGHVLHNGVAILRPENLAGFGGNKLLVDAIEEATESVRKGSSLAAPLGKSGLFPLESLI